MWTYRRIARNRRDTAIIAILLVAVLAPVVLGVGYLMSAYMLSMTGSRTVRLDNEFRAAESGLIDARNRGDSTDQLEGDLAVRRAALVRSIERDRQMELPLMLVTATALAGGLALVMWTTAWSPAARILTQLGALPAGERESAASDAVRNLAVRVGLPRPKLYVIETSFPSMFADGKDPHSSSIAVTRGLLDLVDQKELEALLAHELSHIGNHDIGLNSVLTTVSLFMKFPYLMLKGRMFADGKLSKARVLFFALELLASPIALYVFVVAPLLGVLIRAVTSHDREYQADADAAALTGTHEPLLSALAKIAGAEVAAGSVHAAFARTCLTDPRLAGGWSLGGLTATHPPLTKRMDRLAERHGYSSVTALQQAVDRGKAYASQHQNMTEDMVLGNVPLDDLAAIHQGNFMGRVFRVMGDHTVDVYESAGDPGVAIGSLEPGELVVGFDDPGRMRQVNTSGEVFGYIDRAVKLQPVAGVLPQEIYNKRARVAAEEVLARSAAAGPGGGREGLPMALGLGAAVVVTLTFAALILWK